MSKFGKVVSLPMFLSVVLAAAAGAQGAAAQCDVDENNTVGMAVFALTAAQQPGSAPSEVTKQLRTAIGRLFTDDVKANTANNGKNPYGRAYILGKVYMMFLSQEGMPVITSRGNLGFKTDTATKADLSVGIDSAFKVLESKSPECAALGAQWRQQQGWVRLVQQAMDLANDNKIDKADTVAHQALRISPTAPYSHLVLGNVAAQRQKNMDAIGFYKDALEEASKDTVFNDVRRTILYTLGNFAADAGQNDTVKANKDKYFAEAKAAFEALSKDPGKQYADAARQGMTGVLRASGDTAAIHNACKDQVANPNAYAFLALVQCGVTLAEVKDIANATKLFEAASAQSPFHRDGLYNLALMQIQNGDALFEDAKKDTSHLNFAVAKQAMAAHEQAVKTTDRLMSIDPSNDLNLRLYVHAYNGIRRTQLAMQQDYGKQWKAVTGVKVTDQAKKRALLDSSAALDNPKNESLNKIVVWNTKADSMPVRVAFTEFTPAADKATLSGSIFNRTDKEQSYVLNIEFLDKTGAVIGTGKATVDKVAPKSKGDFTVTGTVPNIAAFKYAPIDK